MVEFAMVAILLLVLVFGIIQFGFLLSFKQDMTRAAAEGARAGAVAVATDPAAVPTEAWTEAHDAVKEAVKGFPGDFEDECGTEGLTCTVLDVWDCDESVAKVDEVASTPDCVKVELVYDYAAEPILPAVPILSALMPDQVSASSVARVND